MKRCFWLLVAATLIVVAAPSRGYAVTIMVTTTTDNLTTDGEISLREAITAASTDAAVGDAPAGSGADVIVFDPQLYANNPVIFHLNLGELSPGGEITILGPGRDLLEVNGNGVYPGFGLQADTSATISGLTVRNGNTPGDGGGIFTLSNCNLTLSDIRVVQCWAGNYGGGISAFESNLNMANCEIDWNGAYNGGGGVRFQGAAGKSIIVSHCQITRNLTANNGLTGRRYGGGLWIYAAPYFLIADSQIIDNTTGWNGGGFRITNDGGTSVSGAILRTVVAFNKCPQIDGAHGGGYIDAGLPVEVRDCTFMYNYATVGGGGLSCFGAGPITLTNCTFSYNYVMGSGGGLNCGSAQTVVTNCTVTSNGAETRGGGLLVGVGNFIMGNTIIADNASYSLDTDVRQSGGFVGSNGYNLIGSVGTFVFHHNTIGDRYGDTYKFAPPNPGAIQYPEGITALLGPLADNGGPAPTHLPLPGSIAIDNGNPATAVALDQRGVARPQGGGFDIGAVERSAADPFDADSFDSDPLMPQGSFSGWSTSGFDSALGFTDYSSTEGAIRLYVAPSADRFRVAGVISNLSEWIPYSEVGPDKIVRGKYWVFAGGQSDPGDLNQIPNLRLRLANRFAVNSMLEVFHHDPNEGDPNQRARYSELRPSTDPSKPSLYRVDFDPIDVPYLQQNAASEGVLRGAEAYAIYPSDQGYIALAESVVATYPSAVLSTTSEAMRVYASDGFGAGSLAAVDPGAEVTLFNLVPGAGEGSFGTVETVGPIPTYGEGPEGITLATAAVPTDRVGIGSREINIDGSAVVNHAVRPRVSAGRQYTVRWHLTSTQQVNQQSQIRLRARTNKFGWSQKLEIGGAWATDGTGTYPLNANNSIAQQALPGVGSVNPDQRTHGENGGWYTLNIHTPLSADIRTEFAPGTPLSTSMPMLSAEPGYGVGAPSRRDLFTGIDLVDTISGGAGRILEVGHVTADEVQVREHLLEAD